MSLADRTALTVILDDLGDDEVRVLLAIARRLAMGRRQYGELALETDRRDWRRETSEEVLDACVYMACALLTRRGGE